MTLHFTRQSLFPLETCPSFVSEAFLFIWNFGSDNLINHIAQEQWNLANFSLHWSDYFGKLLEIYSSFSFPHSQIIYVDCNLLWQELYFQEENPYFFKIFLQRDYTMWQPFRTSQPVTKGGKLLGALLRNYSWIDLKSTFLREKKREKNIWKIS